MGKKYKEGESYSEHPGAKNLLKNVEETYTSGQDSVQVVKSVMKSGHKASDIKYAKSKYVKPKPTKPKPTKPKPSGRKP